MTKHIPVLLHDVMAALGDLRGRRIIDATFGAGGYTRAFLRPAPLLPPLTVTQMLPMMPRKLRLNMASGLILFRGLFPQWLN